MTAGNGLAITYTAFNKPETIERGASLIAFVHDPERQRYKQISMAGETLYLADSGAMAEKLTGSGGIIQWTNYLFAGGEMVGMRVERSDATIHTRYFHKDHLGSIATITDAAGVVVERLSYDAWGKRRHPTGEDDPTGSIASQTSRGFTGHEVLDEVGLVHMNGRVYDPMLGRFGTPDPMTEDPYSTQGWNRYTYVGNSPVNFTDPSGYCFMGCFWQKPFKALGKLFRKVPILGQLVQIAAAIACAPTGLSAVCAGAAAAVTTGLASGDLGMALKAGFIAMATAQAFDAVGTLTAGAGPVAKVAAHAAVGCGSAVLGGGECGPGALSAAIGAATTVATRGMNSTTRLIAVTTMGGVASVAGGGKFGNGALTAAFGYLFNEAAVSNDKRRGYSTTLYGDGTIYNDPLFADGFNVTALDPEYWVGGLARGSFGVLARAVEYLDYYAWINSEGSDDSIVSLYHQGDLSNGAQPPKPYLSTSESPDLAHYNPGGSLHRFDVPRNALDRWESHGWVTRNLDNLKGTSIYTKEIRILEGAYKELNRYMIPK